MSLRGFFYRFLGTQQPAPGVGYSHAMARFQTYPMNNIQGGGTLTGHNNWRTTQPPQVMATHSPVMSGAGGTFAGQIISQPLVDPLVRNTGA